MVIQRDVHENMLKALKDGDKAKKQYYSNILSALKNKAKDLKVDMLDNDQAIEVITKQAKQIAESIEKCPASRVDLLEDMKAEQEIILGYLPKQLSEDEINKIIDDVLATLGIDAPSNKDRGMIMNELMPKVKGKADGKVVSNLLMARMH